MLAGLIAGVSNTGLLVLINTALGESAGSTSRLVWKFIGLCALMLVGRAVATMLLIRLARGAVFELRMSLCRRFLAVPLRQLEELGASRLLAALTDDAPVIANALITIPVISMHFALVGTCLIYLGWLAPSVFFGVMGFMVFGVLSYLIPVIRAQKHLLSSRKKWDTLFKHFRALTEGAKELKLHRGRRNSFFSDHLVSTAESLRQHGIIGDSIYAIAASWGQLLVFILIGLLVFGGPSLTQTDTHTLTAFSLVILYMMVPLETIINTLPALGRADVAMRKVKELGLSLDSSSAEVLSPLRSKTSAEFVSLELVGVEHSYRREGKEDTFTLGPINLHFQTGELVFLVGGNGSGKTTLAKLLTGLYVPEAGEVRLNGRVVNDENREDYRQLFSVVFSDFYLFEELLGLDIPALDATAREYLLQLQLDHKVEVKDGILSTTNLSQGQRKRLALMTAYLEDRPFYVFDEWAADQDPFFKEIFYFQLLPELKARGKAILVISHDDRYFHVADHVIKLDYGKIDEYLPLSSPQAALSGAV
jgi:putative ATP-binding cassette transporter